MCSVPVDRCWDPQGIAVVHCAAQVKPPQNSFPRRGARIVRLPVAMETATATGGVPGCRRARPRQRGRHDCCRDSHHRTTRSEGVDKGKYGQRHHHCPARLTTQGRRRMTMRSLSWTSSSFPRRRLHRPCGRSPPPHPPPPPPPLDVVSEDRVRGSDVDNDHNGPLIVVVVMLGWLRKRTRRGTWVRRWFGLDLLGGVHDSCHPPPPPGSLSGLRPLS